MHSDMELYLEEGAVLRGTEVPDDYLPRIWSRFEGREMETLSGLLNLGELDHKAGATSENVVIRGKGTIEGGVRVLMERVIEEERVWLWKNWVIKSWSVRIWIPFPEESVRG